LFAPPRHRCVCIHYTIIHTRPSERRGTVRMPRLDNAVTFRCNARERYLSTWHLIPLSSDVCTGDPMADEILCSIQDGIATLILNRPEKRNAINQAMMESLTAHFNDLEQHRDIRVVVIRGAGKVFCAGRDLREMG